MEDGKKSSRVWLLLLASLALIAVIALIIGVDGYRALQAADSEEPLVVRFSLPSGPYEQAIDLEISANHPDAAIYFSTDGSIPTAENGTLYDQPLHIPAGQPHTAVVRAQAYLPDGQASPINSATYFLNLDTDIPLVSLVLPPEELWDETRGIFAEPEMRGPDWERAAEIFFYDPSNETGFQAPTGLRVHGAFSRSYEKKGMRLYFRDEYGLPFLEYPLYPDSERDAFKRLVLHNGGQDFPAVSMTGTLLRNQLVGNLARKVDAYATYSRPVLLFINGELWGVYNLRERIDERYLAENYAIEDGDLLSGFESNLNIASGDLLHWQNVVEFIENNDLREADNYEYLNTQVNIDNYIDYIVFQFITANSDWPHNNQVKFRDRAAGRWHWMFWDSDYVFGLLPDGYIEKDMFQHVLGNEGKSQRSSGQLFNKLLENPQFKAQFLSRMADMLNTVFLPEDVLAEINTLAAALENDIAYEMRRWPGTGDWPAGVDYMRAFARQRPDIIRDQAVAYFDLPGTALVTINQSPGKHGGVSVNGRFHLGPDDLPWQGIYFQGVDLQLTAVPAPGYHFSAWQPNTLPQTQTITIAPDGDLAVTPHFAVNKAGQPGPGDVRIAGYGLDGGDAAGYDGAGAALNAMEDPILSALEGEWVELQVQRLDGVDLRGWRVTDNDSKTAADEGSLIIGQDAALAAVPPGTSIILVATQSAANDRLFPGDDLSLANGRLILYAGNDNLDTASDPWFAIGPVDNLVLLAPGPTSALADDIAIDFLAIGDSTNPTTPADFGLLGE